MVQVLLKIVEGLDNVGFYSNNHSSFLVRMCVREGILCAHTFCLLNEKDAGDPLFKSEKELFSLASAGSEESQGSLISLVKIPHISRLPKWKRM